ncbi:MAG: DegT/DnrJ/EryC1/StrS family aminotransferase [Armatimonadota bacterium]
MSELAMHGGPKAKPTGYNSPNRYGDEEKRLLSEAIDDGALMYTSGSKVGEFEQAVQERFGCEHAIMTTSGSAAIHIAMAAVGVAEGDEVITTAMGDAGTTIGIVAQHAIPIFADIDLDSATATLSAGSSESLITERTRAILVVHMGGNIADLDAFLELGRKHGVAIVEDCSQAHGGKWKGKVVGTLGDVGAFSMNESKHMSTGDGGFLTINDPECARLARLMSDKTYIRDGSIGRGGQPIPFLGLNYRPNCLIGAVGLAQLDKLPARIARHKAIVGRYYDGLSDLPHLVLPSVLDNAEPAWWSFPARYVGESPTRDELLEALRAEGLSVGGGMAPSSNALRTELIRSKRLYPLTDAVPHFWRDTVYDPDSCPNVDEMQRTVVFHKIDERYTDEDVEQTIAGFRKVWRHYFGVG